MTEPELRRRADDHRPEVRLPRSLVISFVVSFAVLVIVGLLGIVVTNKRAADAASDSQRTGQCLLLQLLEGRAYTYANHQAAAAQLGVERYDDELPDAARPPDLDAVLEAIGDACDGLVPAELLRPPVLPTTTTTAPAGPSVIVVPGDDGRDGATGSPGPQGPPGTASPAPGSTTTTSTSTPPATILPPITIPIMATRADDYAAGMSVAAAFAGAALVLALWRLAHVRLQRLHQGSWRSARRHPAGHTIDA